MDRALQHEAVAGYSPSLLAEEEVRELATTNLEINASDAEAPDQLSVMQQFRLPNNVGASNADNSTNSSADCR